MPITVLLADDHAVVREGLRALLSLRPDLSVVGEASTGTSAVQQVRQWRPDVVIMDIAMPGLGGIAAAAEIRRDYPATQVVMLSVHATSEHVFRAFRAGALGYVLKESAGQEVVDAVRLVHAGRRYLSPLVAAKLGPDFVTREVKGVSTLSPLQSLSAREHEVLQLVVEGWSSADIAARLDLSPKTIETFRSRIMTKLGVHSLPELIRFAIANGLTPE